MKHWSIPDLHVANKKRKSTQRAAKHKLAEYLEDCAGTRKLPGSERQKEWEEILANSYPACTAITVTSMLAISFSTNFADPLNMQGQSLHQ